MQSETIMRTERRSLAGWMVIICGGVVPLLLLYVGGYYFTVYRTTIHAVDARGRITITPNVTVYPEVPFVDFRMIFFPIHAIDRRLRPAYWGVAP
jgi:hypothetical protein